MNDQNDDKTQTYIVLTEGTMVSQYRIVGKMGAGRWMLSIITVI